MFTHADKCLGMNRVASHEIDLSSVEMRWQVPLSNNPICVVWHQWSSVIVGMRVKKALSTQIFC